MTRKLKGWLAAHSALAAVVVTLVCAGGAVAAWVVYSASITGTATGSFGTAPAGGSALTVSSNSGSNVAAVPCTAGTGASCTGGTTGVIGYKITNNDTSATWSYSGGSVTFATTGHPECDSHIFVATNPANASSIPAGGNVTGTVSYKADPTTPTSCSGAAVVATLGGTVSSP